VGTLGNLYDTVVPDQPVPGYYDWERIVDGVPGRETRYATTVTVDDALDAIAELPEPWLVYVAFHAPHEPLDPPPAELAPTFGALPRTAPRVVRYYAMVEALDTEIGRLLDSVDADVLDRTTVFFLSDNGTPPHAVLPPLDPKRAKITLFEGGVRVPFVVAGPLVEQPGTETDALVHVIDLFPTLAGIARVPVDGLPIDGTSLLPLLRDPDAPFRDVVHTESFTPIGPPGPDGYTYDARASRDDLYKVMEFANDGAIGIFDVRDGLDDGSPRLPTDFEGEERERVDALVAAHRAYWASLASGP
jgi:arylsulfatase A-like enzyme